ncbi:MAG TPA: hypothetical protein VLR50_18130 [Desulfobacterales bacterium]|jgi:hypothetical protein|nr:hypothetical protein [Desulfobacterales bacterium]
MEHSSRLKGQLCWVLGLFVIGAAVMLFACSQEGGQPSDLSKKAPPSLGAIADVDGADDAKKEGKKAKAGAEQAPASSPAGSQPAQVAPKQ